MSPNATPHRSDILSLLFNQVLPGGDGQLVSVPTRHRTRTTLPAGGYAREPCDGIVHRVDCILFDAGLENAWPLIARLTLPAPAVPGIAGFKWARSKI